MWQRLVVHATPVEGVFSLVALVCAVVSVHALRDAMIDASIQTAAKINGPRRMVADNNIHQEQLRLAISVVMVLAAISFLFLEPPPPDYLLLPQSLVGLIAWILVGSIVMVSSFIDRSVRKRLQQYAPIEVTTKSVTLPASVVQEGGNQMEADIQQAAAATQAETDKTENGTRRSTDSVGGRRADDKVSEKET